MSDSLGSLENSTESAEDEKLRLSKTLLAINEAYKETIDEKIATLRKKLVINQSQQTRLITEISLNNHEKINKEKQGNGNQKIVQVEIELNKIKYNYFRDRYNSEPDKSLENIRKNQLPFYDYTPQLKPEWNLKYRNKLKAAVLKDAHRLLKLPLTQKINFLEEKLHRLNISMELAKKTLKNIKWQLEETRGKCKELENYTDREVLSKIDIDRIDWMKIAKIDLDSHWTSTECRLVWLNVCSSEINQEKWTQTELKNLIELARKYKEKNWDKISIELNTNRSAFLCLKRYHEKTVDKYCKRDWNDRETTEILLLAKKLRVGLYIPYNYMCYLNGTRDRNSIYNWHVKVDPNLNHGKWTPLEEQAFEEALLFYNTVYNWQEISEHVVTRTSHQCKDRYELKYHNPDKYINWTLDDDKTLLMAFKKYAGQWFKIAAFEFPNRNDNACLFRHTRLMTWQKQNDWFKNQENEIQEFILFICKNKIKHQDETLEYTDDGQLVPRKPIFAQNVINLVDKLAEKQDLIKEFIQKKRLGQLNLNLLSKIGIYTPALNNTITRYKKHFLKPPITKSTKEHKPRTKYKIKSQKTNVPKVKSSKIEENRRKREALKREKAIEKALLRKQRLTLKKSRTTISNINKKNISTLPKNSIKSLVKKLTPVKVKKKEKFVKDKIVEEKPIKMPKIIEKKEKEPKTKKKTQKINNFFNDRDQKADFVAALTAPQSSDFCNRSPTSATQQNVTTNNQVILLNNEPINDNIAQSISILSSTQNDISELPKKNKITARSRNHIRNIIDVSDLPKKILESEKEKPEPKKRGRKKKSEMNKDVTENNNKAKKPKKELKTVDSVNSDKDNSLTTSPKTLKETKLNQFEKALNTVELSPLIVKFDDIPDGEKIPCLNEQSSMFKFMYLLKKTNTNSKYFYKYIIVNCSDRYVAIKPFNNKVTPEYLSEARLKAIKTILDQVFINKIISPVS